MADMKTFAAQKKAAMQNLAQITEQQKREDDHKPGPNGRIIPLRDANVSFPGKDQMPETTVYCQTCGAVFESEAYTPEELQSGIYMFQSMLHQIKLNAKLSADDRENVMNTFAALDQVSTVVTYYNDMVKKMTKGSGGGRGNNSSGKGHMGMSRGLMSGRGYQ